MKMSLIGGVGICFVVIAWAVLNIIWKWKGEPLDSGMAVGTSICVIGICLVLISTLFRRYVVERHLEELKQFVRDVRATRINATGQNSKEKNS